MTGFLLGGRQFDSVTWYREPSLRRLYALCCVPLLASAVNGFDSSMMNGLQSLVYWENYFHPTPSTLGLLNAIYQIGSFIPFFFVPWFSDRFGRKKTMIIGIILIFIAIALQAGCVNIGMFIAARFLLGFANTFTTLPAPLLITEIAHPQHRAVITTIYNTQYYTGAVVAAWCTFGTLTIQSNWAWRAPSLLQCFGSVGQICFIWFVPESPRYLISKNKAISARAILDKYHGPSSGTELVDAEFDEINTTITLEKTMAKSGWSELWSTKGNRRRFLICIFSGICIDYSGNGLVSQYLSKVLDTIGVTDSRTQLAINGALTTYNLIVAVSICFFVDKIGRRRLFLISTCGMLTSFVAWTIASARYAIHNSNSSAVAVIVFIFFFYLSYNLAISGLIISYAVEILPYRMRAKGLAALNIAGAIGGTIGNYTNPIALNNLGWKFYIVYDAWLLCEVIIVYCFFVETKNTSLEEIAKYFDGDNALIGGGVEMTRREKEFYKEKGETILTEQVPATKSSAL